MGRIISTLKAHAVRFTINSDGPELLGTTVKEEFERLIARGILSEEDIMRCTTIAKKVSFIT